MQPHSRPNLKPSLTWGLIRVFALHKIHYRTPRPPAGFRCGGAPPDARPGLQHLSLSNGVAG